VELREPLQQAVLLLPLTGLVLAFMARLEEMGIQHRPAQDLPRHCRYLAEFQLFFRPLLVEALPLGLLALTAHLVAVVAAHGMARVVLEEMDQTCHLLLAALVAMQPQQTTALAAVALAAMAQFQAGPLQAVMALMA
jgi:hypothetical protein